MFPFRTSQRSVWLITWEFKRQDYFRDLGRRRIVAVLDSRVSVNFVARYLPLLYSTERELLVHEKVSEMYLQSCRRYQNLDWKEVRYEDGTMCFGGHPWLSARRVTSFFLDVFDYDTENAYWIEAARIRGHFDEACEKITPERQAILKARKSMGGWDETILYGIRAKPPKAIPEEAEQ